MLSDTAQTPGPNGEIFELIHRDSAGEIRAEITEVAAGLRVLNVRGVDVLAPYPADLPRPMASGIVLAPWPNRVAGGLWQHGGEPQQLDITEPAQSNAIHGLLRFSPYRVLAREEAAITLAATVYPQHGYPFHLDTEVEYRLSGAGLTVTHRLRNLSAEEAPAAFGAHPYFTIAGVPAERLTLTLACDTVLTVDGNQIPTGAVPVSGDFDLRAGRPLSEVVLDHGFTGGAVVDGRVTHVLADDRGREVRVWGDEALGYWQVFNPTSYPGPHAVVALEPMSAPANAFNSGEGLYRIAPGETWGASWGVTTHGI